MTPYVDHTAFANHAGLSSALPREYVHKSAHSEVLLTGWKTEGPDTFTVTAQWPRTHAFYAPTDGRHDPLLLAETVRQAAHHTAPDGHPTAVLTGLHTTFHRYIELDAPCYITTRPAPAHTVEVQATQNDHLAFAAAATLTPRTT
ncbi:AfsA-related hotdog domain-containing protein [Streptomyces anthocyanicus]|uniref:AfsA-related hotdog domain-containing protein n=1 Tax=Streptomyces anthocyanicus TaxID=68174 RepID=UPI00364F945D